MSEEYKRFGHDNPKMVIWLHAEKSSPRGEALAYWHLKRLSLATQSVAFDYDVNAPKYFDRETTHVVCGKKVCKVLTGAVFDKTKYTKLLGRNIWICHGFEYGLVDAAENYCINRLLFLASQAAGLEPEVDLTVPMYQHFVFKLK